ncbi:hypothetical protein C8039_00850 [Halogeometricum sp. wsp3]|nr:hypothetical protein C8039_00850 [Halogeometricum sp. wsp3]
MANTEGEGDRPSQADAVTVQTINATTVDIDITVRYMSRSTRRYSSPNGGPSARRRSDLFDRLSGRNSGMRPQVSRRARYTPTTAASDSARRTAETRIRVRGRSARPRRAYRSYR